MARPTKPGIEYFPLDVGFLQDIKTRVIMNAYGGIAASILISLLCNIYKDEGYYIRFTDELALVVAVEIGTKECTVTDVINKAVKVGFFDENIFTTYGILTSKGIQERYISAVSRRKEVFLRRDIALININVDNNPVNVCNNPVIVCNNPQSKVKESKKRDRTTTTKFKNADEWEELITSYAGKNESLSGSLRTWVSMRKELAKKRKEVFTTQALRMGLKKLQTLSNGNETVALDIVNQSVELSWKSFYPIKDSRRQEEKKRFILPDYYGMRGGGSNGNGK